MQPPWLVQVEPEFAPELAQARFPYLAETES